MAKMLINGALHDKPAPNDGRFERVFNHCDCDPVSGSGNHQRTSEISKGAELTQPAFIQLKL